jgi:hypothetical protein
MTRSRPDETPSHNETADESGDNPATDPAEPSDDMARADFANGERPEQPESREHAEHDRRHTSESDA